MATVGLDSLRRIPAGNVDVTAPVTVDGLRHIDPDDRAMPMSRVISNNRRPVAPRARADGVRAPDAAVQLGAFADVQFERWRSFRDLAPQWIVYVMAFAGFIRGAHVGTTPSDHPSVSPIEGDLAGYPLAVVVAGTHDPIVDSARAFVERIHEAGGRTVEYFPEGMPHGFYFFPGVHPEKDVAYRIVAEAPAGVLGD